MRHLETLREGQRIAAPGNVEDGQPLRFRFPLQYPRNQPGHVVDVEELDFVIQILLAEGQHGGQAFPRLAHAGGARPLPVGRSAEGSHQVIFDGGSGKNVGTEDEHSAPAQGRRALLHHQIAFFLVDRVG